MKNLILLTAMTVIFLTACTNEQGHAQAEHKHEKAENHDHGDHDHTKTDADDERSIEATAVKNSATSGIIEGYLEIKNALVADDQKGAAKGAQSLLSAFTDFDMSTLTKSQHEEYMEIYENAKEQAEHIAKNPIDHQREHFEVLSTDINDMIALVGTDKTLYQDFCPMASGGKGAIWISENEEITNPFFGSKMLKCGKVQKQIN